VEKIRFSLKTMEQTYGLETRCTVRSITANVRPQAQKYNPECDNRLYFHQPSHSFCFPYSIVVLLEIGQI
jgi:hypothetical protein